MAANAQRTVDAMEMNIKMTTDYMDSKPCHIDEVRAAHFRLCCLLTRWLPMLNASEVNAEDIDIWIGVKDIIDIGSGEPLFFNFTTKIGLC